MKKSFFKIAFFVFGGMIFATNLFASTDVNFVNSELYKNLKNERFSSGTIFVPKGKQSDFSSFGEIEEIEGNSFDLTYSAAFSDLLLGWWPDGMIAMQGSSCFGDGLLLPS